MFNLRCNTNAFVLVGCVIGIVLSGCQSNTDVVLTQDTTLLITSTSYLSPVPETETATEIMKTVTPTSQVFPTKPEPTTTPTLTPEPTATEDPTINKLLLIAVNEAITGLARESVWILAPGEQIPRPLLDDDVFSYTSPTWSNSGELIAYERYIKSSPDATQIGVITIDATVLHLISDEDIENVGYLHWSADDRWLTFATFSPEYGMAPFAVELETERVRSLHPNPDVRYTRDLMKPSPRENIVLYVGFIEEPDPSAEIWLLPLDDDQAPISVEFDMPPKCEWFSDIEWAPDGKSFLVQPDTLSYEHECWPRIFSYDLSDQKWSEVVRAPDENRRFAYLHYLAWSPDGKWLAWNSSGTKDALILETKTWEKVTSIDFRGIRGLSSPPWVQNSAGQSILSITESGYSDDYSHKFLIYGVNFNMSTEETLIVEMAPESEWLPEGMESHPLWWQP